MIGSAGGRLALVLALLAAWQLRTWDLGALSVFGDSASSVYFADRPFFDVALVTAGDSHPPFYYWLLRLSLLTFGWNEVAARVPSLFPGILLVALVVRAGRGLAGPAGGISGAALAAVSPALIYYSRLPRMYALVAALALALILVSARAVRGRNAAIVLGSLALMLTHYFGLLPAAAAAAIRLYRERSVRAVLPFAIAAAAFVPWLLFALPASFAHTEKTISGVAPPSNLAEFGADLGVFAAVGAFLPFELSIALAGAWWLGLVALIAAGWRHRGWPLVAGGLVIGQALLIYLLVPAFGRPRFFIAIVPLVLLAAVAGLGTIGRVGRTGSKVAAASVGMALLLVPMVAAIPPTYTLERASLELSSVRLAEELALARPEDALILHAWWQQGYVRLHQDSPPAMYALRDLQEGQIGRLLADHPNVWLAMYGGVSRFDPAFPIERALDAAAYRVDERTIGPVRLVRYASAVVSPRMVSSEFDRQFRLRAGLAAVSIEAGQPLPVRWEIQSLAGQTDRVVGFIHLLAADGQGVAGRDEEPDNQRPTDSWPAGDVRRLQRGLVVPVETPPGEYRVVTGLYRRADTKRLAGPAGDSLDLGTIRVTPAQFNGQPYATFESGYALLGESLRRPEPMAAAVTEVDTVDGRQSMTSPFDLKPGETLEVTQYWATGSIPGGVSVFLHLAAEDGRIVAQSDRVLVPAGAEAGNRAVRHTLAVPAETLAGRYRLLTGLYRGDSSRLAAFRLGRRAAQDSIVAGGIILAGR